MSRHSRIRVSDRMLAEIQEHLAGVLPSGCWGAEEPWEALREADDRMHDAVLQWERGEISYAELEAEGVRYVEAWEGVGCG